MRTRNRTAGAVLLACAAAALFGCSASPTAPDVTFNPSSSADPDVPHNCTQFGYSDTTSACHQGETYAKSDGATESSAREQCKQQPLAGQSSTAELITACEYGVLFVFHPGA